MAYRKNITLQIGVISFTVDLDGAIETESRMKNVCVGDVTPHAPTPVKNNTSCPDCGNKEWSSFKKAEVDGKEYRVVDVDEVTKAKEDSIGATKQVISLTAHPTTEVRTQTVQGDGTYYLTPASVGSADGYNLLVSLLRKHPEVAFLGLWTAVSRTNLYEVRLFGDTLLLEGRARTESIKIKPQPAGAPNAMFEQQMDLLLPMLTKPFDPATYADTYKQEIEKLIASKTAVEGAAGPKAAGAKQAAATVDLSAQLDAQLAALGLTVPVAV